MKILSKIICLILVTVSVLSLCSCAEVMTIDQFVEEGKVKTLLESPIDTINAVKEIRKSKLDIEETPENWITLGESLGDTSFDDDILKTFIYKEEGLSINFFVNNNRKKNFSGISVNMHGSEEAYENMDYAKEFELFASLYTVLKNAYGEPEVRNIGALYSSEVNVEFSELDNSIVSNDITQQYYVEWDVSDGLTCGIQYFPDSSEGGGYGTSIKIHNG